MGFYVGLDLGGTNIKAGVVDDQAQVLTSMSVPTPNDGGPDAVINAMADIACKVADQANLKLSDVPCIGIGSPGPLDLDRGVVVAMPNLSGWVDVPLRDRVAEATGKKVVLENDANAAALGEFWAGAGRDPSIRHLVMLTLGTGIGSGLIIDGRILHGGFKIAGEGGHMIVQPNGRLCGCGQRGCLESYASATHTVQRAQEALETGASSTLQDVYKRLGQIEAKDVFDAARNGDALARRIADKTATSLAIGCVNFCRLLDPQMIVFAGGMTLAGDYLFSLVRRRFEKRTWRLLADRVQIVPAQLGNHAGFIGAAAVARDFHLRAMMA